MRLLLVFLAGSAFAGAGLRTENAASQHAEEIQREQEVRAEQAERMKDETQREHEVLQSQQAQRSDELERQRDLANQQQQLDQQELLREQELVRENAVQREREQERASQLQAKAAELVAMEIRTAQDAPTAAQDAFREGAKTNELQQQHDQMRTPTGNQAQETEVSPMESRAAQREAARRDEEARRAQQEEERVQREAQAQVARKEEEFQKRASELQEQRRKHLRVEEHRNQERGHQPTEQGQPGEQVELIFDVEVERPADGPRKEDEDDAQINQIVDSVVDSESMRAAIEAAVSAAVQGHGDVDLEVVRAISSALGADVKDDASGPTGEPMEEAAGVQAATKAARTATAPSPEPAPLSAEQQANEVLIESLLLTASKLRFPVRGQPSTEDVDEAMEMLQKAVKLGSAQALNHLGEITFFGEGGHVPDYQKGFGLFEQAAALGDPSGQHNLAVAYSLGNPKSQDDALSILNDFFAAMGGSSRAKMSLGYRHLYGYGVPQSCESAALYYQDVADEVVHELESHPVPAQIERVRLSDDSDRNNLPEDDHDVIQYYQHAAESGDKLAQAALGHLHLYGARGVPQNLHLALRYLQDAAAQGDGASMAYVGKMYLHGLGVIVDYDKALKYYADAANAGSAAGKTGYAMMALNGQGMEKNPKTFMKFAKAAADQGFAEAQFQLGMWFYSGEEPEKKSMSTALQYFSMAAQQGHTNALYHLAHMHLNGLGALRNCQIGVKLLKSVAERGITATDLGRAHRHFLSGRARTALLMYARAADEGFEVAQSNSAWLHNLIEGSAPLPTIRLLQQAADQGNVDSLRLLGDHHYYGSDYMEAAKYYQLATTSRNAQSMFNLGFMHEHGIALPRDFDLAKRYYDQALETDPAALVPVRLALAGLWLHAIYYALENWGQRTEQAPVVSSPSASPSTTVASGIPTSVESAVAAPGTTTSASKGGWRDLVMLGHWDLEDVLLLVLCLLFAVLFFITSQRRR